MPTTGPYRLTFMQFLFGGIVPLKNILIYMNNFIPFLGLAAEKEEPEITTYSPPIDFKLGTTASQGNGLAPSAFCS
jgi:hypothetical protein